MVKKVDRTILITGRNSYIGNSLKNYIVQHQFPVEVDMISMRDSSYERIDYGKYNSIVHVSGIVHQRKSNVSYEEYYQVNVENTLKLAFLAKEAGVKQLVFLSSMAVYGDGIDKITRDTVPNPTSDYGRSKFLAENKLLELADCNFKVAIIRPPMVYGKDCPGNYRLLTKLARSIPMFPNIENQRSMIFIENLCIYLQEIIQREEEGIFHPQNKEYVSTFSIVREIANYHGHKVRGVKCFNYIICYLSRHVNLISKVFGDCIYDNTVSNIRDIQLVEFTETVKKTEINKIEL